ncbi:heterokaryon incompatibility protein-domain-containing protein [Bisporella sp. PMI_857]|nr:heterokaryon incompatibility protein-domain-containing protein [Bisporella sp. PMI_857]
MSQRRAYDALPYNIPKHIRSKLLPFDAKAADRLDDVHLQSRLLEQANIPEFKYQDLPRNKKVIRILRLWPGVLENPQIDCEMFEAEFDKDDRLLRLGEETPNTEPISIKYEALSWRWGDEKNGKYAVMIHKDGKLHRKRVSETLGLALKYLRFEEERFLWIDAICINQENDDERSSQVAMMSLVYAAATKACVWLGEDDEESTVAIKFIREDINQLKNFDSLCKDQKHASKWRSLLMLMQRPWFSRRWVVQEIVLAKNALVYCGPDKIEWKELAIAVELFVEVETATHRLSELMKKDDKFSVIPNWFEHISELGASLLVNATARVYRSREIEETDRSDGILGIKGASRRSLLSLEYLVTSLSIFDCGRPHDSVYALVAIARDARPFAPSALIEKTPKTLASELCEHFLEQKSYILDYSSPYPDSQKRKAPAQATKPERQYKIRIKVQDLRKRLVGTDDKQKLIELLKEIKYNPGQEFDIPNDSEDFVEIGNCTREQYYEYAKTLFVIRIKVRELRKRLVGADDKQKLVALLKEIKYPKPTQEFEIPDSPEECVEIWNCGREQYYEYAKINAAYDPMIEEWFPSKEKKIEEEKNKVDKEEEPPRKRQKVSSKKTRKARELALPSWVVRITAAPFDIFPHPGMDMVKMGRKNADPLVGIPQDGHRNYNAGQTKKLDLKTLKFRRRPRCHHYSLYVKGFWLDTVESVAQASQGGAIPGEWLDMAGWPEARRPRRPGEVLSDPPPEFWRTLVADRGMYDRNPPYYYARACKETIAKGGLQSGAVDTTALMYNERNSIVAEFCRRVQAVIWNRALIKTEKGRLGLASNMVQKGDMICIIYGCTVPLILRKKEYKSMQERRLEKFEDGVESMKKLVRKCEKNRAKRADWERKKDAAFRVIQKQTREVNRRLVEMEYPGDYESKGCESEDYESEEYESEDLTDDEKTAKQEGKKKVKQEKAEKRDPYRHYEFLGESYIHGMMDGEAVRQNFYKLKPDHLFEIR